MIKHDGTTVNIPFLTSYDGYVQRLVIVNRNKNDVSTRWPSTRKARARRIRG